MMTLSRQSLRWLEPRKVELAIFVFGVLLRVSMSWSFRPEWGFDYGDHWEVVKWIFAHWRVPPVEQLRESFHPPLFYATAALLLKLGVNDRQMVALPIICGTARLALIWVGLETHLKSSRTARRAALALAAVLCASIHIDGMVNPEAINGLWTAIAMLLGAAALRRTGKSRWRWASATGVALGFGLLTKISASVILLALLSAAVCEFVFARRDFRQRFVALLPFGFMLGCCVAISGWYYQRNVRDYHKLFLTSFDLQEKPFVAESNKLPYLDRRTLGYVFGFDPAIFSYPVQTTAIDPQPRFWPVAIASTFTDFWRYSFSGLYLFGRHVPGPVHDRVIRAAQRAVVGGVAIAVATILAWFPCIRRVFRQRDFGRLALLLVPPFTILSALHFAIQNPVDHYGVVKGVYMQFGAPPMYALFGIAVAWTRQKPDRWPLFLLLWSALFCVAAYSIFCRLRVPLLPLE